MSNIYVSKPFVIEEGSDVSISPIEVSNKNKNSNDITTGVLYKNDSPAGNYIIKIFKSSKNGKLTFVGFTITDSFGQFTIPLSAKNTQYLIKVYSLKEEVENLELIFR